MKLNPYQSSVKTNTIDAFAFGLGLYNLKWTQKNSEMNWNC